MRRGLLTAVVRGLGVLFAWHIKGLVAYAQVGQPSPPTDQLPSFDAVVLAGGSGRRLGGVDKAGLLVAGRTLLARTLVAVGGARTVVIVGPHREGAGPALFTRERPSGGGPVAALGAAIPFLSAELVAVVAVDLPFLTAEVLVLLASRVDAGIDGALLVDSDGRDQLLVGVWRLSSLRRAMGAAGPLAGASMRAFVHDLVVARVSLPATAGSPWWDCDTPVDLATARSMA